MELVICIKDNDYNQEHLKWIKNFPVKDEIYTVRKRVHTKNGLGYLLEEIVNPLMDNGVEPNFHNSRFKPLENNTDIKKLIKNEEFICS